MSKICGINHKLINDSQIFQVKLLFLNSYTNSNQMNTKLETKILRGFK